MERETKRLSYLREKAEGSSGVRKLKEEASELRGILKCSICRDRQKEVYTTLFRATNRTANILRTKNMTSLLLT